MSSGYERDLSLVSQIKSLYCDTCQICGKRLNLGKQFYSEVHHIHPLYLNGPDIIENMIVLCPNHHVLFDRGVITIDLDKGMVKYIDGIEGEINIRHNISRECVDFNNENTLTIRKSSEFKVLNITKRISYGSKVILKRDDTKEEMKVDIQENDEDLTYIYFQLINHKIGEVVTLNKVNYVIYEVL